MSVRITAQERAPDCSADDASPLLATQDNIRKALNWVVDRAAKDDIVMLVYIGQGAPVGERTCYFTADSNFKDRAKTALAAGDIEAVLDKLKAQRMCAFVDVNFKG